MNEKLNVFDGVRILSKYIRKHKRNFVLFYTGWLVDCMLTVITPILFAIMIDQIVYYKNMDVFLQVSFVFVVMSVFSCILYFFIYTLHHYLMSMYTFDIKLDIFKKMQSKKASYMSDAKTGNMITMLLDDTSECMHFVIRNIIHSINGILKGVFYLTYIYIISIEAGLVVTLFLPLAVYTTFKMSKKIRDHSDNQREFYGHYVSWLLEILKGITDIRLLSGERTIRKDFTGHQRKLFAKNVEISVSKLTSDKIIEWITLLLQLSVYGVCAYLASRGEITIGNVIVLVAFVFTLKDETIFLLVRSYMDAQSRLTRIGRIERFLSEDDEHSWKGKCDLIVGAGEIEFSRIHFAYEQGKPVLKDMNLLIPCGSHVAIVGKSGCGKTTISSLLIGLYELDAGAILIDGQDLTNCSLKTIRQHIGIVQQDVLLFDATIRDNLLLGNPKASDEHIWLACRKAGIADYIELLPEKLNALLGKEGIGLSGGQRQRLAIARIYLKNPAIIIFDEATSALDSETEKIVHESWGELLEGRTAIIIAHRQSSVMMCDNAVWIEDGKVRVTGKPTELLQNHSGFRELFAVREGAESAG
ncbi:ABC transporter ATP-binding protein [Paenibacillus eucommiae]|uniref:ABC-type multidrug transport system fused ATPase/permease subunit n=1 Tax=Paenibacillus eucommiae TaxID=1355755 RepID=A0ABS4IT94_9BACL|nr:ABC transporter ATP-binding protein [Paenibacillus eucommiae]MBP1990788.1 ABC-type multidrug transport system fused ATPase/permease subunit [Paenibacillus eucommiae]